MTPSSLTMTESATVAIIRATVILSPTTMPDPAILFTIASTARESHVHGLPFNQSAVLSVLYPGWTWVSLSGLLVTRGAHAH